MDDTLIWVAIFNDHQFILYTSLGRMAGSCEFSKEFKSWMWIIEYSEVDSSFQNEDLRSAKDTYVSLFDSQSRLLSRIVSIAGSI